MPVTTDKMHRWLHLLQWSYGIVAVEPPGEPRFWQLDAKRGGRTIIARAPTQYQAYWLAIRMAAKIERTIP